MKNKLIISYKFTEIEIPYATSYLLYLNRHYGKRIKKYDTIWNYLT